MQISTCKRGHFSDRYASGECIECRALRYQIRKTKHEISRLSKRYLANEIDSNQFSKLSKDLHSRLENLENSWNQDIAIPNPLWGMVNQSRDDN